MIERFIIEFKLSTSIISDLLNDGEQSTPSYYTAMRLPCFSVKTLVTITTVNNQQ